MRVRYTFEMHYPGKNGTRLWKSTDLIGSASSSRSRAFFRLSTLEPLASRFLFRHNKVIKMPADRSGARNSTTAINRQMH